MALKKNKTLTFIGSEYCRIAALKDLLNTNHQLGTRLALNWGLISIAKHFVQANNQSQIRHSILALLPEIMSLAEMDYANSQPMNISKFMGTQYFQRSTTTSVSKPNVFGENWGSWMIKEASVKQCYQNYKHN